MGRRSSSDPALLWLWCRPAATAPIGPLAWEPPYAAGTAVEKAKIQKNKKKKIQSTDISVVPWPTCSGHRVSPDLKEASGSSYSLDEEAETQQAKLSGSTQTISPAFLSPHVAKVVPKASTAKCRPGYTDPEFAGFQAVACSFMLLMPFILNSPLEAASRRRTQQ